MVQVRFRFGSRIPMALGAGGGWGGGSAAAFEVGLAFESSFSPGAPGHVSNICFSQDMQTDSADAAF